MSCWMAQLYLIYILQNTISKFYQANEIKKCLPNNG